MELTVMRDASSELGTPGRLFVDGDFECYTLEPPVGLTDSRGFTAIPAGLYRVELNYSKKFRRIMPEVCNVPGRLGIRLHWGNWESCTDGCILTGEERDERDEIWNTREAFGRLFAQLAAAAARDEQITIEIRPASPAAQEV